MMNHFSPKLRNVMAAAFVVIFAMLGILKYRELVLVQNSIDSAEWVKHTYQVTSLLDKNLLLLDDAETGQRGYLLTGREEYLEPFISASPRIGENLDDLSSLVRYNPALVARVGQLKDLTNQKLTELNQTIVLKKAGKSEEALNLVISNKGKSIMDNIRSAQREMATVEQNLLAQREQSLLNAQAAQSRSTLAGGLITAGLLIFLYFAVFRIVILPLSNLVKSLKLSLVESYAQSTQQEKSLSQQAVAVTETSSTVEELTASAIMLQKQGNSVIDIVKVSKAATIKEQIKSTENLKEAESLSVKMKGMSDSVAALAAQLESVKLLSNTISDISKETNILALNASVESARAGEPGKGFAEIAKQIRNLADQSKANVEKSIKIIADVDRQSNAMIMESDGMIKTVDKVATNASESNQAFEFLSKMSNEINSNVMEIILNSNQQTKALGQIDMTMRDITIRANEIVSGVNITNGNIERLNAGIVVIEKII